MTKHILVVGSGSIGKRHLRNFKSLGCEVSAVDPRQDRLDEANEQAELQNRYTSLNQSADFKKFDGVVIATPPRFHYHQCLQLAKSGLPILLEKPGTTTLGQSKVLADSSPNKFLLAYCYRWWPSIIKLREYIQTGKIGRCLNANFTISAHIEDWHPWENYRDFFLANKWLGGGALLDENHFVDLMIWFWGMPRQVIARLDKISDFEIDVEDNVDIIFIYDNGLRVTMHLDLLGRPHEKSIMVRGDEGTLKWYSSIDYKANRIDFAQTMDGSKTKSDNFTFDRNSMFIWEAEEFLDMIDGKAKPSCTLQDGIKVLELIEACFESSRSGRAVNV